MTTRPFTVGIIQDSASTDMAATLEASVAHVREAAARGAQIICLKELFNAPYFAKSQKFERFDIAEPIPGPTTDVMQKLAKELAVVIIVPIFEKQARGVYRNSAAIVDADGSLLGVYRKMHIPDDPLFNEKYYFVPGDALPFYPPAIGWHPAEKSEFGAAQQDAWRTIQRSHAIANGVFVASPNRVGHEDEPGTEGIEFFGHSFIADPFGRILAEAGTEPSVLVAKCDRVLIESTRRNWPFLRDRRIDAYAPILSRYIG